MAKKKQKLELKVSSSGLFAGSLKVHNYKMKEIIVITALLVAILSVIFALRGDK
jgi:hypothetical protein